jgi:hypothetical protein
VAGRHRRAAGEESERYYLALTRGTATLAVETVAPAAEIDLGALSGDGPVTLSVAQMGKLAASQPSATLSFDPGASHDRLDRLPRPAAARGRQAQKELFHNEALARIDALVQPVVEAVAVDMPPVAPMTGQCRIVGVTPDGDFAGQAAALACWTSGGWRFVAPRPGMAVWSLADGAPVRFEGGAGSGGWTVAARQPAIPDPDAGGVVDIPARAAIRAILATLRVQSLIIP